MAVHINILIITTFSWQILHAIKYGPGVHVDAIVTMGKQYLTLLSTAFFHNNSAAIVFTHRHRGDEVASSA